VRRGTCRDGRTTGRIRPISSCAVSLVHVNNRSIHELRAMMERIRLFIVENLKMEEVLPKLE
jgi:hypothetical protein